MKGKEQNPETSHTLSCSNKTINIKYFVTTMTITMKNGMNTNKTTTDLNWLLICNVDDDCLMQ